jgi:hypothetical protein
LRFNPFYGTQIHADFQDLIPLSAFICENLRPISHYAYWGTTLLEIIGPNDITAANYRGNQN